MKDKICNSQYASYSLFYIRGFTTNYRLRVCGYSGTAGDSLTYHNLINFITKDNDSDLYGKNCASSRGTWWYKSCYECTLNGGYGADTQDGIVWFAQKGTAYYLQYVEMKIRRI